jgi:GAF domain-containing protein
VDCPFDRDEKLETICELLQGGVAYYEWVGFYIVDASQKALVLGPFVGEPTEHVRITFGKGICGQAAERQETFIVQDVSQETNYLSCSPSVQSEIVVPIFKDGEIVGELDIDPHTLSPFTQEDREFLEDVCQIVSDLFLPKTECARHPPMGSPVARGDGIIMSELAQDEMTQAAGPGARK